MSFFENTRKPVGFGGKLMVAMMNVEMCIRDSSLYCDYSRYS